MMIFPALYPNTVSQQFESLRGDPQISELLVDVLDFIEQKMLRMRPEKRATCKEVVQKFREIRERASVEENYCLQPVPGHPKRVKTDLSTLSPHVFDTTKGETSKSQLSHGGILGSQSQSPSISRAAEKLIATDEHERLSMPRVEDASPHKRNLEVPRRLQEHGEKTRLDHSPSTNRSSSRSTKHTSSKPQSPAGERERARTWRGLRQRLRSLRCW